MRRRPIPPTGKTPWPAAQMVQRTSRTCPRWLRVVVTTANTSWPSAPWLTASHGRRRAWLPRFWLEQIEEFVDAGSRCGPIRHHLSVQRIRVTAWAAHAGASVSWTRTVPDPPDDPTADEELVGPERPRGLQGSWSSVDAPLGTLVCVPERSAPRPPRKTGRPSSPWKARRGRRMRRAVGSCGLRWPRTMGWRVRGGRRQLGCAGVSQPAVPDACFLNLACCESQCGRASEALDHLGVQSTCPK